MLDHKPAGVRSTRRCFFSNASNTAGCCAHRRVWIYSGGFVDSFIVSFYLIKLTFPMVPLFPVPTSDPFQIVPSINTAFTLHI